MKILFTSHTANFVKFNKAYMKWFQDNKWEVHYASMAEEEIPFCDKSFSISFHRSPYSPNNVKAYFQLKKIIDRENYDCIHCHTPMGGVVTRLAARAARKQGTKILYTAHGFHFYKGAPLINNLVYKNVERYLARYVDALITINQEDYQAAQTFHLAPGGQVYLIPGVGVDTNRIRGTHIDKAAKKQELGIAPGSLVILTISELIKRKNYHVALRAFAKANPPNTVYLICGTGALQDELKKLVKELNISDRVLFAGYRSDIHEIVHIGDIFLFLPKQEGLGLGALEAMCTGMPLIASNVRGVTEYAEHLKTGYLCPFNDVDAVASAISTLSASKELRSRMGACCLETALRYDIRHSMEAMQAIYRNYI